MVPALVGLPPGLLAGAGLPLLGAGVLPLGVEGTGEVLTVALALAEAEAAGAEEISWVGWCTDKEAALKGGHGMQRHGHA